MIYRPTAYLRMIGFMLPGHEQNSSNLPSHFELSGGEIAIHFEQALTNPGFEIEKS